MNKLSLLRLLKLRKLRRLRNHQRRRKDLRILTSQIVNCDIVKFRLHLIYLKCSK
jgi:hypothetical protein